MRAFPALTFALTAIFALNLHAEETTPHQYPFLASIQIRDPYSNSWKHQCAGSIISNGTVLTNQYCISMCQYYGCGIVTGAHDVAKIESNQTKYTFKDALVHKNYDSYNRNYDFGLIYTEETINEVDEMVAFLQLAENSSDISLVNCTSPGWMAGAPAKLQHVNVTILEPVKCRELLGNRFEDRMICGYDPEKSYQLWEYGGPLLCNGTMAGIGSWNYAPSGSPNSPAVFSNISKELDWIKSNIKIV